MPELMVILKKFFAYNDKKLELSVGAYSAKGYSMIETTEEASGWCWILLQGSRFFSDDTAEVLCLIRES
jgi:hypothetical protein